MKRHVVRVEAEDAEGSKEALDLLTRRRQIKTAAEARAYSRDIVKLFGHVNPDDFGEVGKANILTTVRDAMTGAFVSWHPFTDRQEAAIRRNLRPVYRLLGDEIYDLIGGTHHFA